jgi:hypothetical protein
MLETASWNQVTRLAEWPEDFRWVLEQFLADVNKFTKTDQANAPHQRAAFFNISPRFYVAQNRQLVATSVGISGWQYEIVPLLKKIVGA